jgi:threonine/homoserine/homoserine lactone efflux protein
MDWHSWFEPKGIVQSFIATAVWAILVFLAAYAWKRVQKTRQAIRNEREQRTARRKAASEQLKNVAMTPVGSPARADALFWINFQISKFERTVFGMQFVSLLSVALCIAMIAAVLYATSAFDKILGLLGAAFCTSLFVQSGRLMFESLDQIRDFEKVIAEAVFPNLDASKPPPKP